MVRVRGLRKTVHIWQLFAAYIVLRNMHFCHLKFLSDQMGLGKTVEVLCIIALHRLSVLSYFDVKKCRERQGPEHLPEHEESELENPQCPSRNPLGIQCRCVIPIQTGERDNYTIVNRITIQNNSNLILVPRGTVPHWYKTIKDFIDFEDERMKFRLKLGYDGDRSTQEARNFSEDDRSFVYGTSATPSDPTAMIVLSSPQSYNNQVTNKFGLEEVNWGLIAIDEHHTWKNEGTVAFRIVARYGQESFLVLVSGTPHDNGPADVLAAIRMGREHLKAHRIEEFKYSSLRNMAILKAGYEKCVKKPQNQGLGRRLKSCVKAFGQVMGPLMIRRRVPESVWLDKQPLVRLPLHTHEDIRLRMGAAEAERINKKYKEVTEIVVKEALLRKNQLNPIKVKSTTQSNRILAYFPGLASVKGLKKLKYTDTELTPELKTKYTTKIREIVVGSVKLDWIRNTLLGRKMQPEDKLVIASMYPVVARIIFYVSRVTIAISNLLIPGISDGISYSQKEADIGSGSR